VRSFPLHVGGEDRDGVGWRYVMSADAMIANPRKSFAVKRALELGREVQADDLTLVAGRCAFGEDQDNLDALQAAAQASRQLRLVPLATRREIGYSMHAQIDEHAGEIIEVLVAEGHPRRLAEWEVDGMLQATSRPSVDWAFEQISQTFEDGERRMLLTRKPDGVVCINPPQNAAGANSALGIMALLAGNALVVKAPKTAPLGVMHFFREIILPVLQQHGAPPGTLNIISGYSKRILNTWLQSPLVNDIMFFGDSTAGLRLGQECVNRGKKPILELAGNDGFLVWRDADLDAAAEALTESFYGSSQICMVPKQAVLHPAIAAEFTSLFLAKVANIKPAYPSDPDAVLSPVLKIDKFYDFLGEARQAGCEVLCGGDRIDVDGERALDGAFVAPTVVQVRGLDAARRLRCVREETFFPLLPLVIAEEQDDAALLEQVLEWMDQNPYGLRNSVWASDPAVIDTFARGLNNGGLLKVNDSHIGFVKYLATHGGTGRTGGPFGELHYPMFRTSHLQGISIGTPTSAVCAEESLAFAEMVG
jgi:acyl-CoA reductase-like NAD-dependent aldehyde dehydrogenase